jgi:tripartite-type tricarboxylate transporter receptor subunit TctC
MKRMPIVVVAASIAAFAIAAFAMAGLAPANAADRLNKELRAALTIEEVRKRILNEGGEPESTAPEGHAAIIDREETKWSTVIHGAGITLGE